MHSIGGKRFVEKGARGLHVFPGKAAEVDFEVLYLPEVKKALKKGWLKKIEKSEAEKLGLFVTPKKKPAAVEAASSSKPAPAASGSSSAAPAPAMSAKSAGGNGSKKGRR
jgi:hypothetical protein